MKRIIYTVSIVLVGLIIGYQLSLLRSIDEMKEESVSYQPVRIDKNTVVLVESYDNKGRRIACEEQKGYAEFVGKTRQELIAYVDHYNQFSSEEEKQRGFQRMEIKNFSKDCVTLEKIYGNSVVSQGYWIALKDNVVIVYNEDKYTVYEYTNIEAYTLPMDIRQRLVDGIHVTDEKELFDFLQTYSS